VSAAVTKTKDLSTPLLTQVAETVTRFGVPAFILCLPLEFTSQLFKLQLARIVLGVVALAYAYLVVIGVRKVVLPLSASNILLAGLVTFAVLSWLFTRAAGSLNALADIVLYPVVAVLVFNLSRSELDHRNAWIAFLVSGIAIAILVVFLHFTHLYIWRADPEGIRVNATFGDPNVAARFLTLTACAGVVLFAGRVRLDRLAAAAVALCSAFTAFTLSKSALLLYPASLVISVFFGSDRRRAAVIAAVGLVIFGASVLTTPGAEPRVERAIQQITGGAHFVVSPPASTTNQQIASSNLDLVRVYLINAGWQMFLDHPITGVGFGGYQHALTTTYKRYLPAQPPATLSHTAGVTLLAELGLVGMLLFLGFLVLLARDVVVSIRRRTPWRNWVLVPAVVILPILAYSQVEGRMLEEPYLWLALGLLYSARALERSTRTVELPSA
jgi:O-antigen ligase